MDGFTGECWGATPPDIFAPFGNSAIISYHSVNFAIQPYLSVNSAIVVYPLAAFQTSEFVYVIRLALKFNKSFKVINI